jgi:hypothetical protein
MHDMTTDTCMQNRPAVMHVYVTIAIESEPPRVG